MARTTQMSTTPSAALSSSHSRPTPLPLRMARMHSPSKKHSTTKTRAASQNRGSWAAVRPSRAHSFRPACFTGWPMRRQSRFSRQVPARFWRRADSRPAASRAREAKVSRVSSRGIMVVA